MRGKRGVGGWGEGISVRSRDREEGTVRGERDEEMKEGREERRGKRGWGEGRDMREGRGERRWEVGKA